MVGFGIVHEYCEKLNGSTALSAITNVQAMLQLAEQVPRIKAVVTTNGTLMNLVRDSNGSPHLAEFGFLDNSEYDWKTERGDWIHRPLSQRAYREMVLARMGLF